MNVRVVRRYIEFPIESCRKYVLIVLLINLLFLLLEKQIVVVYVKAVFFVIPIAYLSFIKTIHIILLL